jgi:hypothetical protein
MAESATNLMSGIFHEDSNLGGITRYRRVPAPFSIGNPGHSVIQAVYLAPDEDVIWNWAHTPDGSYVCGYSIHKRDETSQ